MANVSYCKSVRIFTVAMLVVPQDTVAFDRRNLPVRINESLACGISYGQAAFQTKKILQHPMELCFIFLTH